MPPRILKTTSTVLARRLKRHGERSFAYRRAALRAAWALQLVSLGCESSTGPTDGGRGQVLWRTAISQSGGGWLGTPAIVGDRAYFELNDGVTALDVATGAVLWHSAVKATASPAAENIAARNGRLFLAEAAEVLSLDAATGAILWRFTPDAQAAGAESAVDDVAMYIGTRSHKVYALDVRTGTPLWTADIGPTWSFPGFIKGISVSGDTVYAGGTRQPVRRQRLGVLHLRLRRRGGPGPRERHPGGLRHRLLAVAIYGVVLDGIGRRAHVH